MIGTIRMMEMIQKKRIEAVSLKNINPQRLRETVKRLPPIQMRKQHQYQTIRLN